VVLRITVPCGGGQRAAQLLRWWRSPRTSSQTGGRFALVTTLCDAVGDDGVALERRSTMETGTWLRSRRTSSRRRLLVRRAAVRRDLPGWTRYRGVADPRMRCSVGSSSSRRPPVAESECHEHEGHDGQSRCAVLIMTGPVTFRSWIRGVGDRSGPGVLPRCRRGAAPPLAVTPVRDGREK